jgi:phenylacetate-CoA ligase
MSLEARARRWMRPLMPLYHRLPGPLRDVAVSARGGPGLAIGARSERDPAAAAAIARERLAAMVAHAVATTPYWAQLFGTLGLDPRAVRAPGDLVRLPLLERPVLRDDWAAFQSRAVSDRHAIHTSTSGTTGGGLRVRSTGEAYARTWAQILRHRRWAGVPLAGWRVTLFGSEVIPRARAPRRLWTYNVPDRQILLSAYHLSPRWAGRYRTFLEQRALPVEGFPSVLHDLALLLGPARHGRPRARVVLTTGEALSPAARAAIGEAFGAPVLDHYGQDEKVGFVLQCRAGTYHHLVEYGVLEVVDDAGMPVAPGGEGHLVWTGLVNRAMPLLRYRIGDVGAVDPAGADCACGVRYPAVLPTLTRSGDSLQLAGGHRVSPRLLNQLLKECRALAAAQFVQEALDRVTVVVEPLPGGAAAAAADEAAGLARRLEGQFGGAVQFGSRVVDTIAREPSAKRRLVVVREAAHG